MDASANPITTYLLEVRPDVAGLSKCELDKKLTQLTVDTNTAKIAHEENSTDSMAYSSTVCIRERGSFSVCRTVVCRGMLRVSTLVQYLYIPPARVYNVDCIIPVMSC